MNLIRTLEIEICEWLYSNLANLLHTAFTVVHKKYETGSFHTYSAVQGFVLVKY